MELFITAFRTLFFYFFVTLAYRLMGKREIGQLGVIDLIVSILIAELVAISIEDIKRSIFLTMIPIMLLVLVEILLAYVSIKSRCFRTIFTGKPSLIIDRGIINYKEMIRQRYSLDDLLVSLRSNGIRSIDEVEYAFLEVTGKLSIFKYNTLNRRGDYPVPLIVDGVVQDSTLKEIKKSKLWLNVYLKRQGVRLSDVFYGFYKNRKIYLIKREDIVNV